MLCFSTINPDLLILIIAALAILISQNMEVDEIEFLGDFITSLGDLLTTKADQLSRQATQ